MKINGTTYNTPELNFANMTILEGWGLSLDKMRDRPLGFLSGFVALAVGSTPEDAAKVIDEHIKGGGSLNCTPKVGQESQRKGCRNLWEKNCSVRN